MLNINCFKKLCLKANTKKADEIHNYNNHNGANYELNNIPGYYTIERNFVEELVQRKKMYHGTSFSKQTGKFRALLVYNKKQLSFRFLRK